MSPVLHYQWLLPLGALIGYAILMGTNVVRHCFLDGMRALRRYHRLWAIPAALGLCYALFRAGLTLFFYRVLPSSSSRPSAGNSNGKCPRCLPNCPRLILFTTGSPSSAPIPAGK